MPMGSRAMPRCGLAPGGDGHRREVGQGGQQQSCEQHRGSGAGRHRQHPFPGEPGGRQQRGQHRLRPVAQQRPRRPRAQPPEQKSSRPVLRQMKDLAGQEDAAAKPDGAAGVKRRAQRNRSGRGQGSRQVKGDHRGKQQCEAGGWRERVPVGGDEQQHPGAEQQAAEPEREPDGPAWTLGRLRRLPSPDALRRGGVEQAGLHPSPEALVPGAAHVRPSGAPARA
jgi:hypothetical protein